MKSVRYVFTAYSQRLRSSNSAKFIVNSRVTRRLWRAECTRSQKLGVKCLALTSYGIVQNRQTTINNVRTILFDSRVRCSSWIPNYFPIKITPLWIWKYKWLCIAGKKVYACKLLMFIKYVPMIWMHAKKRKFLFSDAIMQTHICPGDSDRPVNCNNCNIICKFQCFQNRSLWTLIIQVFYFLRPLFINK